jgi:hypothetical protein
MVRASRYLSVESMAVVLADRRDETDSLEHQHDKEVAALTTA